MSPGLVAYEVCGIDSSVFSGRHSMATRNGLCVVSLYPVLWMDPPTIVGRCYVAAAGTEYI